VTSITNFVNFLNNMPKGTPQDSGPTDVVSADDLQLMKLIDSAKLLAPPDLAKYAGKTPDEAAKAVQKLQTFNLIELVKQTNEPDNLFLRLTPAGQSAIRG
jgi:hypothetical protein